MAYLFTLESPALEQELKKLIICKYQNTTIQTKKLPQIYIQQNYFFPIMLY